MEKSKPKVLFVLPHHGFRDKELTWTIERLDQAEIPYDIASTHLSEIEGRFGLIVNPDILVNRVTTSDYSAFVFVGEEESAELADVDEVIKLIRAAFNLGRYICSIGAAIRVLVAANVINNRKVTGPSDLAPLMEQAGGFFNGKITEKDNNIITASGPYAVREFAEELVNVLQDGSEGKSGRKYLR